MREIKERKVIVQLELEPTSVPLVWFREVKEVTLYENFSLHREFAVHNVRAWAKEKKERKVSNGT